MTELVHFNRFSSYGLQGDPFKGEPELAVVPDKELRDLIDAANLAEAAVPANCNHPVDGLEPFDLIDDCCVCGTCGAVLKNYGPRQAEALGIKPGWTVLGAKLLSAEVHKALKPLIDLLDYIHAQTSNHNHDSAGEILNWAEMVDYEETTRKLERAS